MSPSDPTDSIGAAFREVTAALGTVGKAVCDLFRDVGGAGAVPDWWPAAVRDAVTEARGYGPGEIAVIQDRWREQPVLVVVYVAAGAAEARLVERALADPAVVPPDELESWPRSSDPRSRVWAYTVSPPDHQSGILPDNPTETLDNPRER